MIAKFAMLLKKKDCHCRSTMIILKRIVRASQLCWRVARVGLNAHGAHFFCAPTQARAFDETRRG